MESNPHVYRHRAGSSINKDRIEAVAAVMRSGPPNRSDGEADIAQ